MTAASARPDAELEPGANRWTIPLLALVGLAVGLIFFAVRTPIYESEVRVSISNPIGTVQEEAEFAMSDAVLLAAEAALGFTPDITASSSEVADLLLITSRSSNAQEAADAANVVANTYVQAQTSAAARIARVAEPADSRSGLGVLVFAAVGTMLGAAVGAIVSFLRSLGRSTRNRALDVDLSSEAPLPIVAPRPDPGSAPAPEFVPVQAEHTPRVAPPPAAAFPAHQPAAHPIDTASPSSFSETDQPSQPGSFSAAAVAEELDFEDHWLTDDADPYDADDGESLGEHERRSLQSQYEAARYERELAHEQQLATIAAAHERYTKELRDDNAALNKKVRMQAARLKNQSGNDQHRVGDLEAQVDALEIELADLRQQLETARIAHTKKITDERGAADRALDNARRQYREELSKHVHTHRAGLAEHREELDRTLAADRAKHAKALEAQHHEYEASLEADRVRSDAKLTAAIERHEREKATLVENTRVELDRQATQHKETIAGLRTTNDSTDAQINDLQRTNRLVRAELSQQQKQNRDAEAEHAGAVQRLQDELAIMRTEIEGERERNAALRADVLRRSAEAHQVVDRAVEERTAQLAELEASVARQREYADSRVREVSAAAEEQARESARREASLTATVSRLKRELAELKNTQSVS